MILTTSETHWASSSDATHFDRSMSLWTEPQVLGYRLSRQIGSGGMGVVYLATNVASGRQCAVKIVRADRTDRLGIERFRAERDILKRLSHPAIVRLIASGNTACGLPYYAMDYIAGRNLEVAVHEDGPLSSRQVANVLRQACRALSQVHSLGMVHRDIKPANMMEGGIDLPRQAITIIDFGLAHSINIATNNVSSSESFVGSPLYSPPEASSGAFDRRSDIYSLGATAYHLLTGRPVFDAHHPLAAIVAHTAHEPVSLRRLDANVSPALNAIVMKCLQKRPEDRYQSVEELDSALAAAI
jgi:serine/threonine protein kinase